MKRTLGETQSTRLITRESGIFTRTTAGSQTLERGLGLLRAFIAGAPALTNAELAERVGLPRPTVSRLTRSLVTTGFLQYEQPSRGYRLSPAFVSMARAYRLGRPELDLALPLMRKVAVEQRVNVGLSAPDGLSMVYLESIREAPGPLRRSITPGIPLAMDTLSSGHAYLAALPQNQRDVLFSELKVRSGARWPRTEAAILKSMKKIAREGYCRSKVALGFEGIACTVTGPNGEIYALNLTFSAEDQNYEPLIARFAPVLLNLADSIRQVWHRVPA
jgi:IclR family transcriptional regulator, positive regulator for flagellar biogenesis